MRVGITNDTVIAFEEAFLAKLYPERLDFVLETPGSDIFEGYRAGLSSALMVAQIQILEAAANIAEAHKGSAQRGRKRAGLSMDTPFRDEIIAEERGEDIAAEVIAREIRRKIP